MCITKRKLTMIIQIVDLVESKNSDNNKNTSSAYTTLESELHPKNFRAES